MPGEITLEVGIYKDETDGRLGILILTNISDEDDMSQLCDAITEFLIQNFGHQGGDENERPS